MNIIINLANEPVLSVQLQLTLVRVKVKTLLCVVTVCVWKKKRKSLFVGVCECVTEFVPSHKGLHFAISEMIVLKIFTFLYHNIDGWRVEM